MAKIQKSMTFSGAMIDVEGGVICEYNKDGDVAGTYQIADVLGQWDGVPNVSVTIKVSDELTGTGEKE